MVMYGWWERRGALAYKDVLPRSLAGVRSSACNDSTNVCDSATLIIPTVFSRTRDAQRSKRRTCCLTTSSIL